MEVAEAMTTKGQLVLRGSKEKTGTCSTSDESLGFTGRSEVASSKYSITAHSTANLSSDSSTVDLSPVFAARCRVQSSPVKGSLSLNRVAFLWLSLSDRSSG